MSSQYRKLSEEEADKLFSATFLMIRELNKAEKQKYPRKESEVYAQAGDLFRKPPKMVDQQPNFRLSPQQGTLPSPMRLQNSPQKALPATTHKLSTDRQDSFVEVNDLLVSAQLKLSQKDEQGSPMSSILIYTPKSDRKISLERVSEDILPHSQMVQEDESLLFLESAMKELKRDLQIKSRGKICKSQEISSKTGQVSGYKFYCKNDSECPFSCQLVYSGKRDKKNEKLYKLIMECDQHQASCIEEEQEITFMRLTKLIDSLESDISLLLSQNGELKPKEILTAIAEKAGQDTHKFIYKGLSSKNYCKAAKKYFDNLIYKIKSQMGFL